MAAFFASLHPAVYVWLILTVVFAVVELITVGLTSIWFAAGALVALILAAVGAHPAVQFAAFLIVSVALLFATKSWVQTHINSKAKKTNADSLVGDEIRIVERVSNIDQTGSAVVRGQEWTVRTLDDKEILEPGTMAKIVGISGVKLIVERQKED